MNVSPSNGNLLGSGPQTIRVLLVDDHAGFRLAIRKMILMEPDLEVSGEASDGEAAMKAFREHRPDVVLLDISLPGTSGIEIIKMMRAEQADVCILVLSEHDEAIYGLRSLRAGAKGYLRKEEAIHHLGEALRTVAADDYHVSRRLLNQVIRSAIHTTDEEGAAHPRLDLLTDRELEVFQWLGQGLGTVRIADIMSVSVKTVETHRAHIREKFCLEKGSDVVKLARQWHALEGKTHRAGSGGQRGTLTSGES